MLHDENKRLQESNTSLQEHNSDLQEDATKNAETITKLLASANEKLKRSDLTTIEDLPNDILWDIFGRLPVKELLRCRAACRTWCCLTSTAAFLLAHHRCQPSLPLVSFLTPLNSGGGGGVRIAVDTLDFRQSLATRRPVLGFNKRNSFIIHASCDGLLILSLSNYDFYVCNPATRQWCAISALTGDVNVAALYLHRPSGEYRVLYYSKDPNNTFKLVYYVVTLGSSQRPRCISPPMASPSMELVPILHANKYLPVLLHRCLHWHPTSVSQGKVTIFDTVIESFRWMRCPTVGTAANLVEIDSMLGITHIDGATMEVKLWVLQDYNTEVWSLKRRIKLPSAEKKLFNGMSDHFFFHGTVVLENLDMLLSCQRGHPHLPGGPVSLRRRRQVGEEIPM